MEILVDRGVGIDVHKQSLTVCVMTTEGRKVIKSLRRFSTFHRDLLGLRDWLGQMQITHAAMEATGEYWKPVYEVLEGTVELVVANAQHVKNVPGRKSDPEDAAWLARLLRHGLLQPSFVPSRPIRDLRDVTRLRRKTIEMSARIENRAQKVLEASGIKLGSVLSDVFGATGSAILKQLASNRTEPMALAELARGSLKKKKGDIVRALESSFSAHDAKLLEHQLILHEQLQQRRSSIESQLLTLAEPYSELLSRLDQMPGINRDAAIEILGGKAQADRCSQGRSIPQVNPDPGCHLSRENQGELLPGQVCPPLSTSRAETSHRRRRAFHARGHLSHHPRSPAVPGSWSRLVHKTNCGVENKIARPTA
jgi:transposase